MPRPNHDLPNLLIGGVKDYAEREDLSRDEAHAELLKIALADADVFDEYFPASLDDG